MVPTLSNVRVNVQLPDGVPSPPWSSQPLAQRKLPSSAYTLCINPLVLVHVIESPPVIVTVLGTKVSCAVAWTLKFAASAAGGASVVRAASEAASARVKPSAAGRRPGAGAQVLDMPNPPEDLQSIRRSEE